MGGGRFFVDRASPAAREQWEAQWPMLNIKAEGYVRGYMGGYCTRLEDLESNKVTPSQTSKFIVLLLIQNDTVRFGAQRCGFKTALTSRFLCLGIPDTSAIS